MPSEDGILTQIIAMFHQLSTLDVIIGFSALICCILGLCSGLITQLAGIFSVIAGMLCSWLFSPLLEEVFRRWFESGTLSSAVGSVCAFLIGAITVRLLAALLLLFVKKTELAFANRMLGGAFGLIKGTAIAAVLVFVIGRYGKPELLENTVLAKPLYAASEWAVTTVSSSGAGEMVREWGNSIRDSLLQDPALQDKIREAVKKHLNPAGETAPGAKPPTAP